MLARVVDNPLLQLVFDLVGQGEGRLRLLLRCLCSVEGSLDLVIEPVVCNEIYLAHFLNERVAHLDLVGVF